MEIDWQNLPREFCPKLRGQISVFPTRSRTLHLSRPKIDRTLLRPFGTALIIFEDSGWLQNLNILMKNLLNEFYRFWSHSKGDEMGPKIVGKISMLHRCTAQVQGFQRWWRITFEHAKSENFVGRKSLPTRLKDQSFETKILTSRQIAVALQQL